MNSTFSKIGLFFLIPACFSASAQNSPLQAPAQIEASDGAFADRIEVKWSNVGDDVAYNIWRNDKPDATTARLIKQNYTVNIFADQNSGGLQTLIPGKLYYYWVEAVRGNLKSKKSPDDYGSLFTYALPSNSSMQESVRHGTENATTGLWISNDSFHINAGDNLKVAYEAHNMSKRTEILKIHFFISKDALLDVTDEQMAELEDVRLAPNGEWRSSASFRPGYSPKKGKVYLIMTSSKDSDPHPKVVSVRPVTIQ